MVSEVRLKTNDDRVDKAKKLHEQKNKERAENAANVKQAYIAEKDGMVLMDIVEKATAFATYHTKLSKDGIGYRNTGFKLEDGTQEQELFYFTPDKRLSELDKAAGIEELLDYIKRQTTL